MSEKKRLNLTVRDDFKAKAKRIARDRRRSISGLFEDLIDEEWERQPRPPVEHGKHKK